MEFRIVSCYCPNGYKNVLTGIASSSHWPGVPGIISSTPAEDICWVNDAIVVVVVPAMSAILVVVDWTPVVCVSVTADAVVVGVISGGCRPDSSVDIIWSMSCCSCLKRKQNHKWGIIFKIEIILVILIQGKSVIVFKLTWLT